VAPEGHHSFKYFLTGISGGIMLFALFGLSPGSDVLAHLGGFVCGLLLGIVQLLQLRLAKNKTANIFAGLMFCLLVVCPWWFALSHAGAP